LFFWFLLRQRRVPLIGRPDLMRSATLSLHAIWIE